jgi:hypothetical protein
MPTVNTFYVAANIIFELRNGETRDVLMLVNKVEDASTFSRTDADNYLSFIQARAQSIIWSVEYLSRPGLGALAALGGPARYIIKGVQHVS